jgi:hypothetical protein
MGIINLTRKQLAEFLPDPKTIKQFENLFVQTNSTSSTVEILVPDVSELKNPPGTEVNNDYQATTDAYWIVMTATGKTVTLPKCSNEIIGRVWSITLAATGDVTISTFAGDTVPTPATPAETSVILNRRGSTVAMRCTSSNTWGFA